MMHLPKRTLPVTKGGAKILGIVTRVPMYERTALVRDLMGSKADAREVERRAKHTMKKGNINHSHALCIMEDGSIQTVARRNIRFPNDGAYEALRPVPLYPDYDPATADGPMNKWPKAIS